MSESNSTVFEMSFANKLYKRDYDWAKGSYKKAGDGDRAIATIREYYRGNIAEVRLSAQRANAMVTAVQTFDDAATTIYEKLAEMETLAKKVANGCCFGKEKTSIQKQLNGLSKEINNIVENTKYDRNKLFTSDGKVILALIDNDQTLKLFAKDLSLDIEKVDLTKGAKGTVVYIKEARQQASEYREYLHSQKNLLESAMATIELKMASAVGVNPNSFNTRVAQELASFVTAEISEDMDEASEIYFKPNTTLAARLLKNVEEDTK